VIKRKRKAYFKDQVFLTNIGNKIRELRISKGLSIENLANDCELDYSQIARMELGKVNFNVSFLSKISSSLKVDPKELLP
jgi:transcriptional regulator with XRE-family HTH domain